MNSTPILPFTLLWAENLPGEGISHADLIFSPSVGGMIQDPGAIHAGDELTGGPDGEQLCDPTRDF